MEVLKESLHKNPDIPAKVKVVTVVFFVLSLTVTRALLSSLVLTVLYAIVYTLIIIVVRGNNILEHRHSDKYDENKGIGLGDDSEEEDIASEPSKLVYFGGSGSQYELVQRKPVLAKKRDPDTFLVLESQPDSRPNYFHQHHTQAFVGVDSTRRDIKINQNRGKDLDFESIYGNRPAMGFEMYQNQKPPYSKDGLRRSADYESPGTTNVFGVNRWGLSRRPLHPTALNSPPIESMQFSGQRINTKSIFYQQKGGYPSSKMSASSSPQTSSPFHNKSHIGLWDTMSLSAIAGSPTNFISPINSPTVGDTVNYSPQYVHISSPSSEKRLGLGNRHHPTHTTGHLVDLKRHSQPMDLPSSQWQKWNKRQPIIKVRGRPKLQSSVTVRIAHPDRSPAAIPQSRRPFGYEETAESLRKDVILSALREKRKRGKVGDNQSLNQDENASLDDAQSGSNLKKRRLNNTEDSRETFEEPIRKRGPSGASNKGRLNSLLPATKETHRTRPSSPDSMDSLNESTTSKFCPRTAIESSLSSSRLWKKSNLKRSLQPDEKAVTNAPPKKISRATDISGLISDGEQNLEKSNKSASEEAEVSNEERPGEDGQFKLSIPSRHRKRAVFTTIHRGKQAKPPSPNQVTASDLNEDRQRARERIQQMRQLLRDETATPKETPRDTDKPLLPVAKPPSSLTSPSSPGLLSSTFLVVKPLTAPSQTESDGNAKSSTDKRGLLDQLLKEDPITKKLAEDAKKNSTPPNRSLFTTSGLGLFNTASVATSASSVPISSPSSASQPSSLLQALSSMRETTPADQTSSSLTTTPAGELGFNIVQSIQASATVLPAASTPSLPASTIVSSIPGKSTGATITEYTTAAAQSMFNFGDSNLSGTSSALAQPTLPVQPSFQFGSATSSSASQIAPGDQPKASFSFGASTNLLLSGTQIPVSNASQPPTSAPTSSSNAFAFGNTIASKQTPVYNASQLLPSVQAPVSSASQLLASVQAPVASASSANVFAFGNSMDSKQSSPVSSMLNFGTTDSASTENKAPAFNFGAAKTQQSGQTSSFSFGGGANKAVTTQSSTTLSNSQFTFGAKATSMTTPSLFQQSSSQATTISSTATAAPAFTFGGAKPNMGSVSTSTTVSTAVAQPSFSFGGQSTQSSGLAFGSQQSKQTSQTSIFPSSQPAQSSGFSFGSQSTSQAPLFPAAAQQQQAQQTGFSFGNQNSQPSGLFQSASAPSVAFGAGVVPTTPSASAFQFGGSTGTPAQQSTPSFAFGGANTTPQFGLVTPVKPATGFSMGTSAVPRKTASARMRQRARAGRR